MAETPRWPERGNSQRPLERKRARHDLAKDRLDGPRTQWARIAGNRALDNCALAVGRIDRHLLVTLGLTDLNHQVRPLGQKKHQLFIDRIDELTEFGKLPRGMLVGHGFAFVSGMG